MLKGESLGLCDCHIKEPKRKEHSMRFDLGRHNEETVEYVMLADPCYIKLVLDKARPPRRLAGIKNEIIRLMGIFDMKPILAKCAGSNCKRNATRACLCGSSLVASWWCDQCYPVQVSSAEGKLKMISTYRKALNYVARYTGNGESDYRQLIQDLARAKGLGNEVDKDAAQEFFCPFPAENRFLDLP